MYFINDRGCNPYINWVAFIEFYAIEQPLKTPEIESDVTFPIWKMTISISKKKMKN